MEPVNQKSLSRNPIVWVVLMCLLLVGAFLLVNSKSKTPAKQQTQSQETIYATQISSAGHDVVSFDVLVQYDASNTHIGTVRSSIKDFEVVQKIAGDGILSVTAIKLPTSKEGTVFDQTPVLEIPVTYANDEAPRIKLIQEYEKNTTKLIDSKLNVMYGNDAGIELKLVQK